MLAFNNPLVDPELPERKFLTWMDTVTTILFALEALSKILAYGFLFNGKKSYLRNYSNILDFIIVIFGLGSLALTDSNSALTKSLSKLKVIRVARVLRPLRIISRSEGL